MDSQEAVFVIGGGKVRALYDHTEELVDWRRLGRLHITRASHVEFNNDTQLFEARLPDGTLIATDETKKGAVGKEIRYFQAQMRGEPCPDLS